MSTYAIGDVQGCYDQLLDLLNEFNYEPEQDVLWFAGDLVNRGPKSLDVLRFVSSLKNTIVVLGNHDLHLLAVAYEAEEEKRSDTFQDVLTATDCEELCHWLRKQKLFYHDPKLGFSILHAGLPPAWDITQAGKLAAEVETVLQSEQFIEFLKHMYGNTPNEWTDNLSGWDRLRFITNCFTRIRFCDEKGCLDLHVKGKLGTQPKSFYPWYALASRKTLNDRILFGHWAALEGITNEPNAIALDTGCVWGRKLSAFRLDDKKWFQVPGL